MKTKVFWSKDECEKLAKGYVYMRKLGHARLFSIEESQGVLPENRRRNIASISQMPKCWHEMVEILTEKATEPATPMPEPPKEIPVLGLHKIMDSFIKALADKVYAEICERIEKDKKSSDPTTQVACKHNPNGEATSKPDLRKIVIVGTLKKQTNLLEREFPSLSIIGIEKTAPTKSISEQVKSANLVFGMTTHMSHQLEDIIVNCTKSRFIPYIRVHGGMTKLREELTRRFK